MKPEDLKIGQLVIAGGYMGIITKTEPATVFLGNGLRQEVEVGDLSAVGFRVGNTGAISDGGGIVDFQEILGYVVYEQVLGYLHKEFGRSPVGDHLLHIKDIVDAVASLMEKSQWTVPSWARFPGEGESGGV